LVAGVLRDRAPEADPGRSRSRGAYQKGVPVRSLYNFRVPIRLCDELGFFLAEDFYWFNPSKLPSPIEWVNKRKLRAKDAVNTVWWFSKTEWPKADVSRVLAPYSDRMKKLMEDPDKFYTPKLRPSGHDIGRGFAKDILHPFLDGPGRPRRGYLRWLEHDRAGRRGRGEALVGV